MTIDNMAASREEPVIPASGSPLHRPAGTGATYLGLRDVYRFLVTGANTAGKSFANRGTEAMRASLTFTPADIERFFEETRYAAAAPRYGMEFLN